MGVIGETGVKMDKGAWEFKLCFGVSVGLNYRITELPIQRITDSANRINQRLSKVLDGLSRVIKIFFDAFYDG